MPILIGWVCTAQDAFAMFFVALSLHFRLSRKGWQAWACAVAALLSKESAGFFFPALIALRWILEGDRRDLRANAIAGSVIGLAWVVLHGAILRLAHGTGEGGYVGFDNPMALGHVLQEFEAVVNLPITGAGAHWPYWVTVPVIIGAALVGITSWVEGSKPRDATAAPFRWDRALILAGVAGAIPALLTALTAKHWFPYYACMPAIGASLAVALLLDRLRWEVAAILAIVYVALGGWSRGLERRSAPTERNLRTASQGLARIESDLRKLHPTLPRESRLHFSVQAPPHASLEPQIVALQAPKAWYADTTIQSGIPERRLPGEGPEYLFWVDRNNHVFEIRLPALMPRSPGPHPEYRDYQKTVRGYAYGLFGSGMTDQAVRALLLMREADSLTWAFDRRLGATFLYADGRTAEAAMLCRGVPAFHGEGALHAVAAVLTPRLGTRDLDAAAFAVFGVDDHDPEAYRFLMFYFSDQELLFHAMRMAEHLHALLPEDEDATAMIDAIKKVPKWESVMAPVESRGR